MTTRLLLARHAETVWHDENRYAGGRSDPALTERGLRQADRLAKAAAAEGVLVVASSRQRRARDTAAPVATKIGVPVTVVPDLHEVDFGELEGHTLAEMDPALVERFVADPVANAFPGAEPPAAAAARATRALRELSDQHPNTAVLVVAHSTLLRLALCELLGLSTKNYRQVFPRLDNVAITEIRLPADPSRPAALCSLNRVP